MKKPLQGSFVLASVAPFAMFYNLTTTKEPPDSNFNSFLCDKSLMLKNCC
jgi:hypothetical protein